MASIEKKKKRNCTGWARVNEQKCDGPPTLGGGEWRPEAFHS